MEAYLALGGNLNERRENILKALSLLNMSDGVRVVGVSPVYETPAAMLYATAKDEDNKPYLNCSVKIETTLNAFELLARLKEIEKALGRDFSRRWSPRPIDLDIIFFGDETIRNETLCVPHKRYLERNFVLDALSWFKTIPAGNLYTCAHQPLIAGVLNVTPDSFSNAKERHNVPEKFVQTFEEWENAGVQMIDVGAESTRPSAEKIPADKEQERLAFVFDYLKSKRKTLLSPKLSIDTYHVETAQKALENGFDVLNDVSGFNNPALFELAKSHKGKKFVFTFNEPMNDVPFERTVSACESYLRLKLEQFDKAGVDLNDLYFDCGIGFGKTSTQSLCLLQNIKSFQKYGVKLYVGHSRKSFMGVFSGVQAAERDTETLALSVRLMTQCDVLRVHAPVEHMRAVRAVSHLNNQFFREA